MAGTTYTIYIVNQSATNPSFWCFQAPPQELADDPVAFANSGAVLAVPLNEKAGLNAETVSGAADDASLRQPLEVSYLTMQFTEQSPESSPLTYYITTGSGGGNAPASGDERSSNLIAITIPDSFENRSCTVRYDGPGRWSESPGEPATQALAGDSQRGVQEDAIMPEKNRC